VRNGGLIFLLLLLLAPVELAAAKAWQRSIPVADQSDLRAVSGSQPPPGSDTRLREPSLREACRIQGIAIAVVSVSDSGPGIPPRKFADVFDPFFTTKKQGMGMGLSIARTIVQAHKGRIWAENQPEGGVVFHLTMPLAVHWNHNFAGVPLILTFVNERAAT
jgi:signal transduction histidine kinase